MPFADRVFGPNTATQDVYDVAAKAVIKNAMEGINGKPITPYRAVLIVVCRCADIFLIIFIDLIAV